MKVELHNVEAIKNGEIIINIVNEDSLNEMRMFGLESEPVVNINLMPKRQSPSFPPR